ncbi:hypothetical protein [Salegentibacter chungangensis]|uniref:Uncharacterized protein n=1 Tax=Salegentibacter chungangensis TaxID=1335724 RepID=A0ABW3NPD8_9FLAO
MEDSSQNRKLIKKYVGNFVFREKAAFGLDFTGILKPAKNLGYNPLDGKFISIKFGSPERSKKPRVFRCMYKMMKRFNRSLN